MKNTRLWTPVLLSGAILAATQASAYTMDGNLADWGITGPNWAPETLTAKAGVVEDQPNSSYLEPGYGGQAFDAEAMYVDWDSSHLYIAIVTGLAPNNATHGPGDIAIGFSKKAGDSNKVDYKYAVKTKDGFGTFNGDKTPLDNPAYVSNTTRLDNAQMGGVYRVELWGNTIFDPAWNGPWKGKLDDGLDSAVSDPTSMITGTLLDFATLAYAFTPVTLGTFGGTHYVIEAAIPLSVFGADWTGMKANAEWYLHWTQNCANDAIDLTVKYNPPNETVPEPATLALLGLGLAGIGYGRRKRQ